MRTIPSGCVALVLCVSLLVSGCAGLTKTKAKVNSKELERKCTPSMTEPSAGALQAQKNRLKASELPVVMGFAPEIVQTADTIDLVKALEQAASLETEVEEKRTGAVSRLLYTRVQLIEGIMVAMLDASSAAAEARCEKARADKIADRLAKQQSSRYKTLSLTAIIIAGTAAIATGGLTLIGDSVADGIIAVVGGFFGAGFAGLALLDWTEHDFQHSRNLLKDIWEGPEESKVFAPSVWRFLNVPRKKAEDRSLREELVAGWREQGRLGETDSEEERKRTGLLFGEGGRYQLPDLEARRDMYEELASRIDLMHEDLKQMARELTTREIILE